MNIAKFSVTKRTITLSVMVLLLIWGTAVFTTMSRREDPEIRLRKSHLVTVWPGAESEKVEQLVTRPLETAIKEVSEVKEITSDSYVGLSSIIVELLDNVTDNDIVWEKIRAKIQRVQATLPNGCYTPDFNTDFGETAAMVLAMYQIPLPGKSEIEIPYTMREMDDMLKDLEDIIQEIPMVGKIEKFGIQKEVIYIEVDGREWGQLAISIQRLAEILEMRNTIAPGGTISTPTIDYAVKPSGEFLSPEHIKAVIVDSKNGAPIHLADLNLTVSRRYEEPKTQYTRFCSSDYKGKDKRCSCLILSLSMRVGYNVVELGKVVREKIEDVVVKLLPPDIKVDIVSDAPRRVDSGISEFLNNLWEAIVIVIFVAFIISGPRQSIIMATAIPISMITAIGTMKLFKVDLEQCSIGSLILVLGMLVDNAVVVSDNVARLIRMGVPKKEAAWRGAQEIFIPILTSTLTTVFAFLPMLTIPGNMGEYIRSLPVVVCSTLMISFFVAMSVTPLMCLVILKEKGLQESENTKGRFGFILEKYGRFIAWCLNNKLLVVMTACGLFIASMFLFDKVGTAFFPKALRDQFLINIDLPAGSSVAQTENVVRQVEDVLLESGACEIDGKKVQRFKDAVTYVGHGGPRFYISIDREPPKTYYAQMMVNTTSKWYTDGFINEVRRKVDNIPGARIVIKTLDLGPPVKAPVVLRIRGKDIKVLLGLANKIEGYLDKIEGTLQVQNNWGKESYQLGIDVDQAAANLAGVNNLYIANTLYGYFSGTKLTTYREGRHEIDVVLRVKPEQRENLDYLDYLYVEGQNGKVPLNAVAQIEPRWQVSLIHRRNLIRTVEVRSNMKSGYLTTRIIKNVMPMIEKNIQFPPGYWLEIGGEYEETIKSQRHVFNALKIAALLIVFTLIAQFNSYVKPFIILLTLPLALIGALLGLWISGWPLGFIPYLGIVSLGGVVVNNAIILLDFIQTAVAGGMPLREAVISSGQVRMRAILITSLTTVGGFIPLALFGGPFWEGLAYVMIFGLSVSTILTLVVIPVVFTIFAEHLKMKVVENE